MHERLFFIKLNERKSLRLPVYVVISFLLFFYPHPAFGAKTSVSKTTNCKEKDEVGPNCLGCLCGFSFPRGEILRGKGENNLEKGEWKEDKKTQPEFIYNKGLILFRLLNHFLHCEIPHSKNGVYSVYIFFQHPLCFYFLVGFKVESDVVRWGLTFRGKE